MRCLVLVLATLLTTPAGAAARRGQGGQEDAITARARIHLEAGVDHFHAGRYADAEREMEQAYRLRQVPELMYNLAQCQERLGALDRAAASYRAYLAGRPDAADRSDVERRLQWIEARLQEQGSLPASSSQEPPTQPGGAPEKVIFKEIVVYREPPPRPGRGARLIGLGLLGLAAAGLATGIAFGAAAAQIQRDIRTQEADFQQSFGLSADRCRESMSVEVAVQMRARQDVALLGGQTNEALAQRLADRYRLFVMSFCGFYQVAQDAVRLNWIGSGVGFAVAGLAALGAGGLFLYGRHLDRHPRSPGSHLPDLALSPWGGPTGAGLVLEGRF